jgi:hypothetical protein
MRRLMVMVVTCAALLGCAASQYKFNCAADRCEVETAGPAEIDLRQEFGETVKVIETADDRVTLQVGTAKETLGAGDSATLESVRVNVTNVKGENAFFTVRK